MARRADGSTARGQARRAQILATGMAAFAAQGFRGASISQIAAEVPISEPGLLHHFPSKRALLIEVLEFSERSFEARAEREVAAETPFVDVLVDIARSHERDPSFIRFFIVLAAESVDPAHPAHDWFARRYDRVRASVAAGLAADRARGLLAPGTDPEMLSRLVIALLDGLELQFLLSDGRLGIADPLEAFFARVRR